MPVCASLLHEDCIRWNMAMVAVIIDNSDVQTFPLYYNNWWIRSRGVWNIFFSIKFISQLQEALDRYSASTIFFLVSNLVQSGITQKTFVRNMILNYLRSSSCLQSGKCQNFLVFRYLITFWKSAQPKSVSYSLEEKTSIWLISTNQGLSFGCMKYGPGYFKHHKARAFLFNSYQNFFLVVRCMKYFLPHFKNCVVLSRLYMSYIEINKAKTGEFCLKSSIS